MSWSASVSATERGRNFSDAVDLVVPSPAELDEHMKKQFDAAKIVAKELGMVVPGPKVRVSMSGHANGIGDAAKPRFSNDFISVNVSQVV